MKAFWMSWTTILPRQLELCIMGFLLFLVVLRISFIRRCEFTGYFRALVGFVFRFCGQAFQMGTGGVKGDMTEGVLY